MSASDEALKVNIYPTGNAFTRNPIFLSVSSYSMATYSIRMNNEEIFKGNGIGEFRVNIAEIVETGIASTPILPDNTEPLLAVSGLSAKVTIHVVNEGEEEYNLSFTAWKGGISKKEFKRLRNMGTDIFSLKFLNESCNFFALPRISFICVSASLRFLNLSPAASSVACSLSETTFAVSADIFLSSSASLTCIPANVSSS